MGPRAGEQRADPAVRAGETRSALTLDFAFLRTCSLGTMTCRGRERERARAQLSIFGQRDRVLGWASSLFRGSERRGRAEMPCHAEAEPKKGRLHSWGRVRMSTSTASEDIS